MSVNKVKSRLREGKSAIGAEICLGSTLAAEVISALGFDFVLVDNQHGAWSQDNTMQAFRSIALGTAVPVARVGANEFAAIGRLLDMGALGIMVPMVNSVDEAQAAAYAVRYPPQGGRSGGEFGVGFHGPNYRGWANDEVLLAVMIESNQAFELAEQIMAVEGVDAAWVGPHDLAMSMGLDLNNPHDKQTHVAAIESIIEACHKTHKVPGISLTSASDAQFWLDRGCLLVGAGEDTDWMLQGAGQALQQLSQYRD